VRRQRPPGQRPKARHPNRKNRNCSSQKIARIYQRPDQPV
jgi:hypothetical protein